MAEVVVGQPAVLLVIKLLCYVNLSFFYSPSEVEKKTALVYLYLEVDREK